MASEGPVFPVAFDELAIAEDLARLGEAGSEALAEFGRELEGSGGLPKQRLMVCSDEGRDGTRLGGCLKTSCPGQPVASAPCWSPSVAPSARSDSGSSRLGFDITHARHTHRACTRSRTVASTRPPRAGYWPRSRCPKDSAVARSVARRREAPRTGISHQQCPFFRTRDNRRQRA